MRILALDTCLSACSAAVVEDGRVRASLSEAMARGHQERLAPLVAEVVAASGMTFADLDRIAVTVGPGSFTGLRVGLAFAKGLGAALGVPVVGIGSLEALAEPQSGVVLAALDARRDQVYLQGFADGRAVTAPDVLPVEIAAARVAELSPDRLVGSGAPFLAAVAPQARVEPSDRIDPVAVARLAGRRDPAPPRPLYLRAPDARLPGGILPA
ncbi:MAG: tRNA (adenosine(37)-N6)-threonylcarbamoyltransferase complex dimerization subunit type 1 TsaB [Phenylobacterium sp.]|uniref:tRNA (adenosine(37)-N6)-threonylcarbamoyltransferase complex dimerization subunit type 1 TsaB n=1 Tax=Phenylobacterium sp. TaxID=1871053 RepID=UPI00391DEAFF